MSRRIIAAALPHLAAEARLRHEGQPGFPHPFAIVARTGGALRLASVNPAAAALGLTPGLGLADARALCAGLITRPEEPGRLGAFRRALARWAEGFSPLASTADGAGQETLTLDATGCAHLFGGEAAMLEALTAGLAGLGLTARAAIADTRGAAWALAHYGGGACRIAPHGHTRDILAALPVAALRLDPEAAEGLTALGLATIGDAARIPRGALARRFGLATLRRLDQALGAEPEPVAPDRSAPIFAARLSLPEPVGHLDDVMAGLDRMLERLCRMLETHQMGARRLRFTLRRADGGTTGAEIALARPGRDPVAIRKLFEPKVTGVEVGFGIDMLRLEATAVEPRKPAQVSAGPGRAHEPETFADLLSRIGNRIGFENVIRCLPAESHIPERAFTLAAAAWSGPEAFPRFSSDGGGPIRPLVLFPPERLEVDAPATGTPPSPCPPSPCPPFPCAGAAGKAGARASGRPPGRFRWRGRRLTLLAAQGPERIAPEWWWDDPAWRSGTRDYWRVATAEGPRLWLFHTPQAGRPEWWAHGDFA